MRKSPMFLSDDEKGKLKGDALDWLANGQSLKSFVDSRSLSYSMVWNLLADEDNSLTRARDIGTHTLADQCLEISDNPTLDPADKRIRIDTRLRLIGKWNRKDYGDKQEVDHKSSDGSMSPPKEVSDRDRAKAMLDLLRRSQEGPDGKS